MLRKWMTLLLSLMLAVAIPFGALADTQHTFTVIPGELLVSEQAIADLLNAVDLRVTEGDRSGALTVLLNDQELVTLGLTADTMGLYASSALLGSDVLYVTWEDGFAMLADLAKASMREQGITDPAAVQSIESTMNEVKNSIVTAVGAAGTSFAPQAPTQDAMEETMQLAAEMFPNDPEMLEYIRGIYEAMTIEDGSFADESRDTADQKYAVVMGADELVKLGDTVYMKTTIREALAVEMPDADEAELAKATAEVIAEVKKLFEESSFKMLMEMYTLDAGQTLVGVDMTMNMTLDASEIEGEELLVNMGITADYNRLTDAEGVSYKANAGMTVDYEKIEVSFDLYRANSGKSEGMLGMLADGEEIVLLYEAENTAADTRERELALYMRSDATSILAPSASERPVIGFAIKTEPAPAETLTALENATPDNSVNVLTLSETEMANLFSTISTNVMQVFYTALGQLPTSVLTMLMSGE